MLNSLKSRLRREGWMGKEVSNFLEKHGIKRSWKTILNDIKNSRVVFISKKVSGYIILTNTTVKKYLEFLILVKGVKKINGNKVGQDDLNVLFCNIDAEIKKRTRKELEKERNKDFFKEETTNQYFNNTVSVEDRIIANRGFIKTVRF